MYITVSFVECESVEYWVSSVQRQFEFYPIQTNVENFVKSRIYGIIYAKGEHDCIVRSYDCQRITMQSVSLSVSQSVTGTCSKKTSTQDTPGTSSHLSALQPSTSYLCTEVRLISAYCLLVVVAYIPSNFQ